MPKWPSQVLTLNASELPDVLSNSRIVAIHCWASWSGYDHQLAQMMPEMIDRFGSMTHFYALDIEDASNAKLLTTWAILNVPAFVIFRDKKQVAAIWMEREPVEQFRKRVEDCLAKASA